MDSGFYGGRAAKGFTQPDQTVAASSRLTQLPEFY
jgi:hypothetical protein